MTTALREAVLLFEHGTDSDNLTPGALLSAAQNDVRLRDQGKKDHDGNYELGMRYAFVASHVRRARGSVQRLLALAADNLETGRVSDKLNTRRVYKSKEKLTLALELAKDRGLP